MEFTLRVPQTAAWAAKKLTKNKGQGQLWLNGEPVTVEGMLQVGHTYEWRLEAEDHKAGRHTNWASDYTSFERSLASTRPEPAMQEVAASQDVLSYLALPGLTPYEISAHRARALLATELGSRTLPRFALPDSDDEAENEDHMITLINLHVGTLFNLILRLTGLTHNLKALAFLRNSNLKMDLQLSGSARSFRTDTGVAKAPAEAGSSHLQGEAKKAEVVCDSEERHLICTDSLDKRAIPVEIKEVLSGIHGGTADDFIRAFNRDSHVRVAVMQAFGYMRHGKSRHGVLCDGKRWWSLFAEDANNLQVSGAYLCHQPGKDTQLSVNELFMYSLFYELELDPLTVLPAGTNRKRKGTDGESRCGCPPPAKHARRRSSGNHSKEVGQEYTQSHAEVNGRQYRLLPHTNLELLECIGYGKTGSVYKARVDGLLATFKHSDLHNIREEEEDMSSTYCLKNEDSMYAHLSEHCPDLLGTILPRWISSGYSHYGNAFFLALECVEGVTLNKALERWDYADVQPYYPMAKKALQQLHAAGVVHGDISSNHVLLDSKSKQVRLIDLGQAKRMATKAEKRQEVADLRNAFTKGAAVMAF